MSSVWRDGDPPGRRQFADLGPQRLEVGGGCPSVRVAYETWGTPSPGRDNAVLVLHALTGDSHVTGAAGPGHPTPGWWDALSVPAAAIDTDRWFVSRPTSSAAARARPARRPPLPTDAPWGSRFPFVTVRDQVATEAALADGSASTRSARARRVDGWDAGPGVGGRPTPSGSRG